MGVGLKWSFQRPSPVLPLELGQAMVVSRQAPAGYSLCRDHGLAVRRPGVAAAGHRDGGSLFILQVTRICLGQVPAKGKKQDPSSHSCLPASVRGKGQVRKTRLCSAGQGARGSSGGREGRHQHHTGSGQLWGTLS